MGPLTPPGPGQPPQPPAAPQPPAQSPWGAQSSSYGGYPADPGSYPGARSASYPAASPAWGASPPAGSPSGGGGGVKTLALVLVAVLAVLALGIATFFVVEALTDDGSSSAGVADPPRAAAPSADPAPDPSTGPSTEPSTEPGTEPSTGSAPDPTPDPVEPTVPTTLQCTGGLPLEGATGLDGRNLTGGGLRLRKPPGFSDDPAKGGDQAGAFTFAEGVYAPSKVIERTATSGWVAVYALGGLTRANGFEDPEQAAGTVLGCMAASEAFYRDLTGSTVLDSSAVTVDGAPAWSITAELRVDQPDLTVPGDVARIVVVDTGDPDSFGLFVSVVPIDDDALIAEQDDYSSRLRLQ